MPRFWLTPKALLAGAFFVAGWLAVHQAQAACDLQRVDGKTIVMVEQNAKKGLEFADIGYVLVSGETAMAAQGDELLENADVGRLFLGG